MDYKHVQLHVSTKMKYYLQLYELIPMTEEEESFFSFDIHGTIQVWFVLMM